MSNPWPANPLRAGPPRLDRGPAGGDVSHLQGDQRRRWARGERVLVEDYLKEFAEVLGDPDVLLDLIYHEVLGREEFRSSGDTIPNCLEFRGHHT